MKVRVIENHWYPKLWGAEAITIFPWILLSTPIAYAIENRILAHEWIHVHQVRDAGWIKFYVLYLWYYFRFRLKGLSHDEAYRSIPFEEAAYAGQKHSVGPTQTEYVIVKWI